MKTTYCSTIANAVSYCMLICATIGQEGRLIAAEKQANAPYPPFKASIFGVGIVEGKGGNINIGTPINRIVDKLCVAVGDQVKQGDPLIVFENSDLQAEVMIQEFAYQQAQTNVKKMKALPRPEDLLAAEAQFKSSSMDLEQARTQLEMIKQLKDARALSQEEINRRYFAFEIAQAKAQEAQANLDKVRAGAWKPDLEVAQLEAMQAKARLMQSKSNLQKTILKSPIDATVLQINIRAGEVPSADILQDPLLIISDTNELNVKVSVNQFDVPYFLSSAKAVAFLQGDRRYEFPLEFIRIEPILVNKQHLTNSVSEKVDTEVLNIIYRIVASQPPPLYVGQQMDVYIQTEDPRNNFKGDK